MSNPQRVCIIAYSINNIQSVVHALTELSIEHSIIKRGEELKGFSHIILPGVGAYQEGAQKLESLKFNCAIQETLHQGSLLLGICLGMQLLFEGSEEYNSSEAGLGLLKGRCYKISENLEHRIRVPHIGWNNLLVKNSSTLLRNVNEDKEVYFNHSFYVAPEDDSIVSSRCRHGIDFAATIESGNIFGCQFHPEKSYENGLQVLRNFLALGCRDNANKFESQSYSHNSF